MGFQDIQQDTVSIFLNFLKIKGKSITQIISMGYLF